MTKSKLFGITKQSMEIDTVLLIVRLVVGVAFIIIGKGKIQNPMGWMGPEATTPGFLQALAAISEFGGGIALLLGLLTRLASLGLAFTMAVAVYFHAAKFGDPFINPTGGGSYQQAAAYLMIALIFIAIGPGRFSLDHKIFGYREASR